MINFLKGLFSSEQIVDDGVKAIDSLVYTDQEKADVDLKKRALMIQFIQASLPMERARRFIAMIVTILWAINGALSSLLLLLEQCTWNGVPILHSGVAAQIFAFGNVYIMPPFTGIVCFYFWVEANKKKAGAGSSVVS